MQQVDARYAVVAEFFAALSSPVRAAIVHLLSEGGRTVSQLTRELGTSQPLVSQHLRVLRAARMVRATKDGRATRYTLLDEHVAHILLDAYAHTQEHSDAHH